jgi:hypothetical protein
MTDKPLSSDLRSQFVTLDANEPEQQVQPSVPHRTNWAANGKGIPASTFSYPEIDAMTDITPEIILQLPILPIQQVNFLPNKAGLYFVCASKTEPKVIYVGRSSNLHQAWQFPIHKVSKKPLVGKKTTNSQVRYYRRMEMDTLLDLGVDVFIRWLVLDGMTEKMLSVWQMYANQRLEPFFLAEEVGNETTFCWDAN